ncbi:MAG: insulinase family protein [Mesosutterella sp.]|nr:insulinase family protein [Mesosutterella sp.]
MVTGTVAAGLAAAPAGAAPAPAAVKVATVEGITEYRLSNGLSVLLFPDQSKPTATVNMTYKVGSRNESYGETGMAHLLEHLMFKGSKNFPTPTAEFSRRGFRMNGSTWLDRTNYHVSFTANDDNMDWALRWTADAMVNSFISRKDLDSEMTVVRNEYEMGENSPVSVVLKRMQCLLFDWHNYGKPTIGARSDIENVEIENLQAFYHRYYQPDNAVLTVSGKFEPKAVLSEIERIFGVIPKPERKLPHEWTVEPTADGERFFTVRRPGEAKLVAVGYRVPAASSPDFVKVDLGLSILTDSPKGRLYKALVDTGLAGQVFGFSIAAKDPGFVFIGAKLKKDGDEEKVKQVMLKVLESSFAEKPITTQELQTAVQDERTGYDRLFSDPENFGVELSEYIGMGDWRLFFVNRDELAKLNEKNVAEAVQRYFVRDNRVVGMFLPEDKPQRAQMPAPVSIPKLIASHTFKSEGQAVDAFDSSQDNINAKTQVVRAGALRMALLPKKTRGGVVTVEIKPRCGDLKSLEGRQVPKLFMESMLTRGTRDLTYEQITDEFARLKIDGDVTSFTTDREHIAEALRFVARVMNGAAIPQSEFDKLKRVISTSLQSKLDDPTSMAVDALQMHFRTYPLGDPRTRLTKKETLEAIPKLTRSDVESLYQQIFQTAQADIAVVGDFDPEEVRRVIESSFTRKAPVQYKRIDAEYRPVAAARIVMDAPQKENAFIIARRDFAANMDDPDAAALITADWIMGGGSGLSNRLATRLRQKDGLSYSVYSSVSLHPFGNRASWIALAITAPQNLSHAEKDMREEMDRIVREGVTAKEVEEAKKGLLQSRAVNRSQDDMIAGGWVSYLEEGADWSKSKKLDEAIAKLTPEDVNRAVRRMIVPSEMTFVLAGDKDKAKKAGKPFDAMP